MEIEPEIITDPNKADKVVDSTPLPLVIKGKGIEHVYLSRVCFTTEEAHKAIDEVMRRKKFGRAGEKITIDTYTRLPDLKIK